MLAIVSAAHMATVLEYQPLASVMKAAMIEGTVVWTPLLHVLQV